MEKYYPGENWRQGYDDIKKYFKGNGYIWDQGSGYHSEKIKAFTTADRLMKGMYKRMPWTNVCVKHIEIGLQIPNHDGTLFADTSPAMIKKIIREKEESLKNNQNQNSNTKNQSNHTSTKPQLKNPRER